ncbi:hypothetical protein [Paenibacillus ehimensis]|uniref:Uncharacterized protein n=1 Tax=Paenibacillus ehimensis TaxID=79264 RepID=A0ABT8VHG1_9BACL|nr:hypothetical protein [Paenibacillus ehimensis]MDO3680407.1 hypothetical protein [Paenibacillus ehimensis]
MKKAILYVTETLTYEREIVVLLPDEMSEESLNTALNAAERRVDFMSDFVINLANQGIQVVGQIDDDLSSPDNCEIECTAYDLKETQDREAAAE